MIEGSINDDLFSFIEDCNLYTLFTRKKPGIAAGLAKGLFIYFLLIW